MRDVRRASIDDVWREAEDRALRRLPGVLRGALRLVARAAPRELAITFALQVVTGAGVAVQLLLGRHVLETILRADRLGQGMGSVLPGLGALLAVTAVVQFGHAARFELQRLLAELVGRHAQERIIDVATAVDLEAYENPDFHDRLERARMAANFRPMNMTMNLMMLTGAGIGVVACWGRSRSCSRSSSPSWCWPTCRSGSPPPATAVPGTGSAGG